MYAICHDLTSKQTSRRTNAHYIQLLNQITMKKILKNKQVLNL